MGSLVKGYSDAEVLTAVSHLKNFDGFPSKYWLALVRAAEKRPNKFNDKFYLFNGERFIDVYVGTTLPGVTGLRRPKNVRGCAVVGAGYWFKDAWKYGFHRGKIRAYVQDKPLPIHRDNDRDDYAEELGQPTWEIRGINIHPDDYNLEMLTEKQFINGWSEGCQVFAIPNEFKQFRTITNGQPFLSAGLLNEW